MLTYDPAKTYEWKPTAFPFTEAESVPATLTEAAVAAAGIATAEKQDEILEDLEVLTTIDNKLDDKTGYKLAADGLDAIADPDDLTPSTVPSTFGEKLRWLIQRFWKSKRTATAIEVYNGDGDLITSQDYTVSGYVQDMDSPD